MRSAFSRPDREFASILDSLETGALCDFFQPVAGVERLWPGEPGAESLGAAAVANRYEENQADGAPAPPWTPDWRIPDFSEVAAEIAGMRSADRLRALRRALALAAHPDRVPVDARAEAERLMAKANAAIDAALSGL
jgi:hypothetical protein